MLKLVSRTAAPPLAPGSSDPLGALGRQAVTGDAGALQRLLAAVGPAMLRAIRKILGAATGEVEDVVQEATEGLLTALPRFRGHCTVLHFACRVAILTALARRRRLDVRQQWMIDLPDTDEVAGASASPATPADEAHSRRRREALGALLGELPVAQAEVLVMHAALGFTVQECAAALGKPAETVRSRLRLAKQALRDRILQSRALAEILEVTS